MIKIDRILFPTDLANGVERTWRVAAFFAHLCDAEVIVAHVEAKHEMGTSVHTINDEGLAEEIQSYSRRDVQVRGIRVEAGRVSDGILQVADDFEIDLLTLATHGHGGVRQLLLGSVTEEVIRTAPCPVVTVRVREPSVVQFDEVNSILVPVDFSQHSRISLYHAMHIAELTGAQLELLHIVEQRAMPRVYDRGAASLSIKEMKERALDSIRKMVKDEMEFERADIHVQTGYASEDIVQWANEKGNDLVVISSHGRSNIERILLGSVTQRVVRLTHCPVLTLKGFGRGLLDVPSGDWAAGEIVGNEGRIED